MAQGGSLQCVSVVVRMTTWRAHTFDDTLPGRAARALSGLPGMWAAPYPFGGYGGYFVRGVGRVCVRLCVCCRTEAFGMCHITVTGVLIPLFLERHCQRH